MYNKHENKRRNCLGWVVIPSKRLHKGDGDMSQMGTYFKKSSIAKQLWTLGICVISVLILIFTISYYLVSRSIIRENIEYTSQVLSQVKKSAEDTSSSLEALLLSMGYNRPVAEFLSEKDAGQDMKLVQDLDSIFYNVSDMRREVSDIILLGNNGQKYYKNGSNMQKEYFFSKMTDEPNYQYSYPYHFTSNDNASFALSTSVYDVFSHTGGDFLGTISFVIDYSVFGIERVKPSFDTRIFLVDERDSKIYAYNASPTTADKYLLNCMKNTSREEGQNQTKVGEASYIVNFATLSKIHMRVVSITPKDEVLKSVSFVKWSTYLGLLAACALFVALFSLFIRHVTSPLHVKIM